MSQGWLVKHSGFTLLRDIVGTARCGRFHLRWRVSMAAGKRKWASPEIRRFGTFETATQDCYNKSPGIGDAWTFQNQPTMVDCSAS